MKHAFAAFTLAGIFALAGAVPALAAADAQSVDPQGHSSAAGGRDRTTTLSSGDSKAAATLSIAGLNDPATAMGIVLWSLVGGGALVAGGTSVAVVRRRAKTEPDAA
jgi:hypothetical protein